MSDVRDLIKKAGAARRSDSDSGCKRVLQSTRALAYATGKIAGMRRR